ncbi:hypothetical protein [Jidongwangia harbinensis]|uniref:hypothetical protein n=1 Tax=Jidongwangia harbinensis TaxID=2878561 RepID=UPI001CDA00B0|nr:hypothetical protein [Jidongwangia harbinensis]MCA2214230.1 hypothetical protein [Jidongwangia harbinensis]
MASTVWRQLPVLIAVLAAGVACSSDAPDSGTPRVATLSSAGSTPSASAAAERPRERLDTTPEEAEAMRRPYDKCLTENGAPSKSDSVRLTGAARDKAAKKFEAANRICEPLYLPLPPWEKDPANPEAKDFARDVVTCIKGKGVRYVEVSEDGINLSFGGKNNHAESIRKGLDVLPDCEREVAARN